MIIGFQFPTASLLRQQSHSSPFSFSVMSDNKRLKMSAETESLFVNQYEQKHQIASGAFSSVFCIRARAKKSKVRIILLVIIMCFIFQVLYAAKYLKVAKETADKEVNILASLKSCVQVYCAYFLILQSLFNHHYYFRLLLLLKFIMQSFTQFWSRSICQVYRKFLNSTE